MAQQSFSHCSSKMAEFSPEQIQLFKKHFNEFTISEHGCVTIKEVGMVLIVLGEYISSYTILDMMKEMGLDENSFIKFNDFLEIYKKVLEEKKKSKLKTQAERAKKLTEEPSAERTQSCKTAGFSQEHIEHVRKQFNLYGDYGNGRITYIDIGLLMMDLNEEHFVTSYEVQDMIKMMGLVVDGTFDFEEFLEMYKTVQEKKLAKQTKEGKKLALMKGAKKPSAKGTQMEEFSPAQIEEIRPYFDEYDAEGNGRITFREIGMLMSSLEVLVPAFKIKEMIKEMDLEENGTFEFRDFLAMYWKILDSKFKFELQLEAEKPMELKAYTEEKIAFVDWINYQLKEDPDIKSYFPLPNVGRAIFGAVQDGIILCKLINKSVPNTVDERAINKTKLTVYSIVQENQTLALNSAASIGCNITNIKPMDIMVGHPHVILDLLWQIIKIGLFNKISLPNSLNLPFLLHEGEDYSNLLAIPPKEILLRWFNLQLHRAGSTRTVHNFSKDINDSECYTILLNQIAPRDRGVDMSPMNESNLDKRAEQMLNQAHKIGCRYFVRPKDVVKGNQRLNLAFVANLFNHAPGVRPPPLGLFVEEPHMEKSFRNWMNSVGVTPFVNNIFADLRDGIVILQLFDKIYPGLVVDWDKVNKSPFKISSGNRKKLENCNYVIELAQKLQFAITGVSGQHIREGNPTFILAVAWETMRAYTLSVLQKMDRTYQPMGDLDILSWINTLLGISGKGTQNIRSFEDPILASSVTILDVVASLKSDSVDYFNVGYGTDEKTMLSNAKYAISMSRKIGARVYALPEDLVEPNSKMYFTVFAGLLIAARLML